MAITLVDAATTNGGSGTAITTGIPSGIAANDVGIIATHMNGPNNVSDNNGADSWTAILSDREYNGPSAQYDLWYRVLDGGESGSFAFTGSGSDRWSIACAVYRGVDTSTIWDVQPTATTENARVNGSGTVNETDQITTSNNGARVIAVAFNDSNSVTFDTTPADEDADWTSLVNNSGEQLIAMADYDDTTAGTIGPVHWDQSASNGTWINNIFALLPTASTVVKDFIGEGFIAAPR